MIKTLLKMLFAGLLLSWLIQSGKLDLTLIRKSFETGPQWFMAFALLVTVCFIGALRYKILLETKGKKPLRFFDVLRLNYIGIFFSSVLPGAVTGDLIKLVYIKKLDSHFTKTFLVTSALLDRILGLSGLLFLAGSFSLIYFKEVISLSPQIGHIILVNLFLFLGTLIFLIVLIAPHKIQKIFIHFFDRVPFVGKKISELLHQVFELREKKLSILKCFLLSILAQFLSILAFWIISSPFYSGHLPLPYVFTFIPVGLIAMAIPISPGGLGVGHVLFANLFSLVNITNGASLFNLFYLCSLAQSSLGLIPYLMIGKKDHQAELDSL